MYIEKALDPQFAGPGARLASSEKLSRQLPGEEQQEKRAPLPRGEKIRVYPHTQEGWPGQRPKVRGLNRPGRHPTPE